MQDLIAALISFFLLDPLQAEVSERLASARVPAAVLADVRSCASEAVPVVIDRATSDPWWAVTSVVGVWTGLADPVTLLGEAAPGCGSAIGAARAYLDAPEA